MTRIRLNERARQRGALLIEVLVALVISAFGLLGYVGLQARSTAALLEAHQRAQAMTLLEDMVSRLNANRANAASYLVADFVGDGEPCDPALPIAEIDLCEWGNLILGSTEERAGAKIGSMMGARGCVSRAPGTSDRYIVSVTWRGILPSGEPAGGCGEQEGGGGGLRRIVATTVCIARLDDPPAGVAVPRC